MVLRLVRSLDRWEVIPSRGLAPSSPCPMPLWARYACLELLGFVGQLKQTHRRLLSRTDVIETLLTVLVRFPGGEHSFCAVTSFSRGQLALSRLSRLSSLRIREVLGALKTLQDSMRIWLPSAVSRRCFRLSHLNTLIVLVEVCTCGLWA